MAKEDLTPTEREFLKLFHEADTELQEMIWKTLPLTALYGEPFLQEMEKTALAKDRAGAKAVLQKWEAKSKAEGACT